MPMTESISAIYEFGASALFGAATKTYFDAQSIEDCKKRRKIILISFIINSVFAGLIGPHIAHLFVETLPEWSDFGVAVAYLSGALSLNIMVGLLSIRWGDVISSRLNGIGKND